MGDPGGCGHRRSGLGEVVVVDEQPWTAVTADELQLGDRQPPVQRHEDGAELGAGELHLEEVGVVVGEHRDPVLVADAELGGQHPGQAQRSLVELGPGEAAVRGQVDHGLAPAAYPPVVGHPIEGPYAHPVPHARRPARP
jgi:hypothetical protein